MTRTHIATLALLAALTFAAAPIRAEDQAPSDSAPKVLEPAGGCMPDGSCCGQPACAHAAGADKAANDAAPVYGADKGAADTGGGCPCAKMKQKAM
jgi:hypothetical protein